MKWINESKNNPGYSVYHATPARDTDVLYVIRQKKKTVDFKPVGWRVFVRPVKTEPLRTIYMGDTLKEAKAYVEEWEETMTHGAE